MSDYILSAGSHVGMPSEAARDLLAQGSAIRQDATRAPWVTPSHGGVIQVLAVVHGWMPYLAAGSERMMQHVLDALPKDSFHVEVLCFGWGDPRPYPTNYAYEGTPVTMGYVPRYVPDIIITHHAAGSSVSGDIALDFPGIPVIVIYHNDRYDIPRIKALNADLEIFNTEWVRDSLQGSGLVIHPPLEAERHYVPATGDKVTVVNLQENKGVNTFYAAADALINIQFLAVEGTHGTQEHIHKDNVEFHPVTQDMRDVWAKTKVVLMPSGYESFGMVAAEACVSGIPVIAHPTPGLKECLGSAGIFIDRNDYDAYAAEIQKLYNDDKYYAARSKLASERAEQLAAQTEKELASFIKSMKTFGGLE